jgi:hypothetical protein
MTQEESLQQLEANDTIGVEENQAADINTQDLTEVPDIPNMNFNRKFRRMLLKRSGYVRIKNRLGYKDWFENIRNNIQNGKQLHASNTEEVIKTAVNRIDGINESTAEFLSSKGYGEERVATMLEKNMQIQEKIAAKKLKQ